MLNCRVFVFAIALLAIASLINLTGCGGTSGASLRPQPPTFTKVFGAFEIPLNGTTTLTFNLSNPNAGTDLTGIGFTDSLPAGLLISTPNGLTGSCGGGTITAAAGSASIGLSSANLTAGASCSFAVTVTGMTHGAQNNTTSAVTSSEGNGTAASATLMVGGSTGKIQHVVVIFQENRTVDNLFQDPNLIAKGADIAQSGKDSHGNTIPLKQVHLQVDYDPSHTHSAFNEMCDLNSVNGQCRMDGADLIPVGCNEGATDCPAPDLQFGYVDPADVQPYFAMAEQYTFADRMFQTNQGPSMPAHQFIISGTSAPSAGSNLFAAENPETGGGTPDSGCDAPAGSTVTLIDPAGNEHSNAPIFPCFEHPTLSDLLEAKYLTWRYYTPPGPAIWNGPEAIQHICGPQQGACLGTDWTNNVVLDQTLVLTDITADKLADVSWVIPSGQESDHAGYNSEGQPPLGPSWVASVVNAIGNSPYWADTAIFITWDDWGGWYDHVPPPQVLLNCAQWGCGYVYGFRVPLIVISPYVKASFISKQQHDFGSILKFIEERYNLPSLNVADLPADDFSDCFDFNQTPLTFKTIQAPVKAKFFLNDKTPALPPDND
jgi:phospholipase C